MRSKGDKKIQTIRGEKKVSLRVGNKKVYELYERLSKRGFFRSSLISFQVSSTSLDENSNRNGQIGSLRRVAKSTYFLHFEWTFHCVKFILRRKSRSHRTICHVFQVFEENLRTKKQLKSSLKLTRSIVYTNLNIDAAFIENQGSWGAQSIWTRLSAVCRIFLSFFWKTS